ncbi:uncharacterized protein C7orf57 homolog [Pleuronectes platessa]|uniref:uncharacterized protein C7orf57 homolog n=1 Tax=Pleuronectes platessa TaxID=8262 RepID=UPI00232A266F|nr:uncharacterized protein C7orf57 homolog [Pleuronectes platessa]
MAEMSTALPNHRKTKPGGIKPGPVNTGASGPTSQIPGLSQSADESTPAERSSGRRVGIFASDSEYVKLAKQGGHKGLLSHDVESEDNPVRAYNPASWFGDNETKNGSKATSPDSQMKGGSLPLAAPFGTDNSSSWEREADSFSNDKDKMSPDDAADELEDLSLGGSHKRTCATKGALPVSMTKLLSHGYIEEKKKSTNDDDASSVTSEQTSTIATEDADVDDLE